MENTIILTDDELSVIQASLQLTLKSHEKFIQQNGEDKLDYQTRETIKEMKHLFERFDREFF